MNTSYVQGQTTGFGELKTCILTGAGPASYSLVTGDIIANPAAGDYIEFPSDCTTQSGNYSLTAIPTSAGYLRAGAPSPTASGWRWLWKYSGQQGLLTVPATGTVSGATPGTYTITSNTPTGGAPAVIKITALTATTYSQPVIVSTGAGFTGAPTFTLPGGLGTGITLTPTAAPASGFVTTGTVLSAEVVQFGAIISQL